MKTKKCYETHKHCNGPSCNYDKSASPSSLTPAQRRLSARNNSRKAFEAVNGGKLPTQPCECGNPDAGWHGDRCGLRQYMCDKCWQDEKENQ